jgi:Flp pilus assembly protein TadD
LFQSGEFDAAIAGFKEGLAIDPANGIANYCLGKCYARQDQDDLARVRYQRAVDLAPGTKEALLAKARLAKH